MTPQKPGRRRRRCQLVVRAGVWVRVVSFILQLSPVSVSFKVLVTGVSGLAVVESLSVVKPSPMSELTELHFFYSKDLCLVHMAERGHRPGTWVSCPFSLTALHDTHTGLRVLALVLQDHQNKNSNTSPNVFCSQMKCLVPLRAVKLGSFL